MSVLAPKRDIENNLLYESFTEEDLEEVDVPHNNALIMMVNILNCDVKRMLIDPGSSSKVMYLNAYNQLHQFIPRNNGWTINALIYSFSGEPV